MTATRFSSGEHWLLIDLGDSKGITGCQCGFQAAGDDNGYGDSVVDHIAAVAAAPYRARLAALHKRWTEIDWMDQSADYEQRELWRELAAVLGVDDEETNQ